jgi:ATP-dependent DNA ligase
LLEWRGRDIREQPLVQRRAQLEAILKHGASRLVRFSESSMNQPLLARGHRFCSAATR